MSGADDGALAARSLAWRYQIIFTFLTSSGRAFYSFQGLEPSAPFEFACVWGGLTFLWLVTKAEARTTRSALPLDSALFVGMFSFLAMPLLLWRGQRWGSVANAARLFGIWLAGYVWSFVLHSVLVSL